MRVTPRTIAAAAWLLIGTVAVSPAKSGDFRAVDPPRALTDIVLTVKGAPIDGRSFVGHWTFLTLGFTNCPDICPTVLSNLAAVRAEIAREPHVESAPRIVFVSVDPERDNPDYLAEYAANFGDGVVGATGKKADIDALVKSLGAFYRFGRKDRDGFYMVSHSAEIYLIDPQVRLRARFFPIMDPVAVRRAFITLSGTPPPADAAGTVKR